MIEGFSSSAVNADEYICTETWNPHLYFKIKSWNDV